MCYLTNPSLWGAVTRSMSRRWGALACVRLLGLVPHRTITGETVMPDPTQGPFVAVATFCEMVIEDKQGILSIIRMMDQLDVTAEGVGVPSDLPESRIALTCVITLKSGAARGRHEVAIVPHLPSGQQDDVAVRVPVTFEGEHRGYNLIVRFEYVFHHEGTHWFEVMLDGTQHLTSIPLRIVYSPIEKPGAPTS